MQSIVVHVSFLTFIILSLAFDSSKNKFLSAATISKQMS